MKMTTAAALGWATLMVGCMANASGPEGGHHKGISCPDSIAANPRGESHVHADGMTVQAILDGSSDDVVGEVWANADGAPADCFELDTPESLDDWLADYGAEQARRPVQALRKSGSEGGGEGGSCGCGGSPGESGGGSQGESGSSGQRAGAAPTNETILVPIRWGAPIEE